MDKEATWKRILEGIKVSVSPAIFSTWFSQTHIVNIKKEKESFSVEIGCPSSFIKNTLENRYFGIIQDALSKELGEKTSLAINVKEALKKQRQENMSTPLFNIKKEKEDSLKKEIAVSNINPSLSFENYAVSSSNQMAWAASEAVSKNPGSAYNPLFIWGGVGVGKTHLMNAVGLGIIKKNSDSKVLFCTGEYFTNDIVEGIRSRSTQKFRNKYRKLDALLIDDVQFIAGKDAVQEEFFHTFNALVASGSQIVMTSDKPPHEISKLEERLRSRFEAGLIVDISQPDFELRCAIVQIKSKEKGIELPMDIVQLIAGNVDSPRRIQGFIVRIVSESKLKNIPITEDFVQSLLGKGVEKSNGSININPNEAISSVCKYFSIKKTDLLGDSRARSVARPRQILMYFLRTELNLPLQEVGGIVGRDHTTVMHAVDKVTSLASKEMQIRQDVLGIKNLCLGTKVG